MVTRDILPCPTFDPQDTWIGMDHDLVLAAGCVVGCIPCPDATIGGIQWNWVGSFSTSTGVQGGADKGLRWLKPDPQAPSRDAHGKFRPLKSFEIEAFPTRTNMLRSPCYDDFETECFGHSVCECHPPPSSVISPPCPPEGCCDYPFGFASMFHDSFWFEGWQWKQNLPHCRVMRRIHDEPAVMEGGPHLQAAFGRLNVCTTNAMVATVAEAPRGGACFDPTYTQIYYDNNSGTRNLWSRVHVDEITAKLAESSPVQHHLHNSLTTIKVKNLALEFVEQDRQQHFGGSLHFDQMEHGNFSQPNLSLGSYGRSFNFLDTESMEALPVFHTLTNCRLKVNGALVSVDLFIAQAGIQMHLVPQKLSFIDAGSGDRITEVKPSVRMKLFIRIGAKASYVDGEIPVVSRPWIEEEGDLPLTIVNPIDGDSTRLPRIINDLDEIVYVHEGDDFVFEPEVEWWGWLGELSEKKWTDVWQGIPTGCGGKTGCLLAKYLSPTVVKGRPTWPDGRASELTEYYEGGIEWSFRDQGNACGDCF